MKFGNNEISIIANLGGFLTGILLFPVIQKPVVAIDGVFCEYKYWFPICCVLLVIFLVSGLINIFVF